MKYAASLALCISLIATGFLAVPSRAAQKDYLSSLESDKIRDADGTNERIKLFLSFADDRIKKFQYELQHPSSNKHPEMLNALMNAYVGCVDDAADLVQLGIQKQENIRAGIDSRPRSSCKFWRSSPRMESKSTLTRTTSTMPLKARATR